MSVLFVIPAKAHSSRVSRKNLRPLGGIPLFLWTVRAALEARQPEDTVLVSTNEGPDGDEIARLAVHEGATVLRRPAELCRDPAQLADVVLHALGCYEEQRSASPDVLCALLPTSPFRDGRMVREALALHEQEGWPNVVSVSDGRWLREKLHEESRGRIATMLPDAYWIVRSKTGFTRAVTGIHSSGVRVLNGAIWIAPPSRVRLAGMLSPDGAVPYVMDEESSVDVDTPLDWLVAEAILARRAAA